MIKVPVVSLNYLLYCFGVWVFEITVFLLEIVDSFIFRQPFIKRFALCYQIVILSVCFSCLSVTLVYCGQTAGWINMPLGMEVGLVPGHIVFDGDWGPSATLPQKWGAKPPIFGPCLLWPNGWMDEAATWYGYRPRPRPHCIIMGPSSPFPLSRKGLSSPPFRPVSIVTKRLPFSATAERCTIICS